jgi:hypothetical protein
MNDEELDTHHKALKINLDPRWYGTLAEIAPQAPSQKASPPMT